MSFFFFFFSVENKRRPPKEKALRISLQEKGPRVEAGRYGGEKGGKSLDGGVRGLHFTIQSENSDLLCDLGGKFPPLE